MIAPQAANVVANKLLAEYVLECGCSTPPELCYALMGLISLAGIGMAVSAGKAEAIARMDVAMQHVATAKLMTATVQ